MNRLLGRNLSTLGNRLHWESLRKRGLSPEQAIRETDPTMMTLAVTSLEVKPVSDDFVPWPEPKDDVS